MIFIVFISFTFLHAYSQNVFRSHLIDKTTKQAIPFATIKVLNKPFGTFTNEYGVFEVDAFPSDTLLITSIGFKPKKTAASTADTIFLEQTIKELPPLIVGKKKVIATKNLGIKVKGDFVWAPSGAGEEFAQKINLNLINNEYCQIKKVTLSVKRFSFQTPALLHIYAVHPISGLPYKELLSENHTFTKENYKNGKLTIDIESENLYVDEKSIFISFERLGYHKSNRPKISTALNMTTEVVEPFTYSRTLAYSSYNWFQAHTINGMTTNTIFTIEIDRLK